MLEEPVDDSTVPGAMVGTSNVSVANIYGAQVVGSGAGTGASVGDPVVGSETLLLPVSLLLSLLRLGLRVGL